MARNRDPFTRALSSLRERIQSGDLQGGEPVIVQDEAQRLRLSTTPIREALARLSGEGLVERAPSGGYVAVRLDATSARERYAMRGEYIRIAIELNHAGAGLTRPPLTVGDRVSPGSAVRQLFSTIVCSAGNQVLWTAFDRIAGQLDVLGRFEPCLIDDFEAEARAVLEAYGSATTVELTERISRYHQRRVSAAAALAALACLRREDGAVVQRGPDPTPTRSPER